MVSVNGPGLSLEVINSFIISRAPDIRLLSPVKSEEEREKSMRGRRRGRKRRGRVSYQLPQN